MKTNSGKITSSQCSPAQGTWSSWVAANRTGAPPRSRASAPPSASAPTIHIMSKPRRASSDSRRAELEEATADIARRCLAGVVLLSSGRFSCRNARFTRLICWLPCAASCSACSRPSFSPSPLSRSARASRRQPRTRCRPRAAWSPACCLRTRRKSTSSSSRAAPTASMCSRSKHTGAGSCCAARTA